MILSRQMREGQKHPNVRKIGKVGKTVLLLLLSFFLGACAGLPTAGDVQIVKRAPQREGDVVLDPKGPTKDASAEQIVSGFLRAASVGLADDFKTARQFLTEETAATWNPLAKVGIYPDSQTYSSSQAPSGAFRVSVSAYGSVDADGIYTSLSEESQITEEFSLIRNADGQWRIAVLDNGILMSRSLFNSLYMEAPLYFPSRAGQSLVADVRWYPRQQVVAAIARGIVHGPAPWIASAVRNVVPTELTVVGAQVRASDSVAIVDLSAGVTALPESSISLLLAQYRQSYADVGVAQDVILTASGAQVSNMQEQKSGVQGNKLSAYPLQESPLIAMHDGAVVKVSGTVARFEELLPRELTANLGLNNLALEYGENLEYGAALGDQEQSLYLLDFQTQSSRVLLHGTSLIAPSFDAAGWIWSGERASDGVLVASRADDTEQSVRLQIPELSDAQIKYLKISREGARAVIVYEREGKQVLAACAVVRGESGAPERLGELTQFGQQLVDIHDLAWIDASNLVLIGRYSLTAGDSLIRVQIGGPSENLNTTNVPVGVTAARGTNSIVVVDQSDVLYEYTSGAWRKIAEEITWPAMAG